MMNKSLLVLLIICYAFISNAQFYDEESYIVKFNDDSSYANLEIDTSSWDRDFRNWKNKKDIFWFRLYTNFEKDYGDDDMGILVAALSTYDAYWDGVYIGSNRAKEHIPFKEVDGQYWKRFLLPDTLTSKGSHVLSLRNTLPENALSYHAYFTVGKYKDIIEDPLYKTMYMFLIAGVFITGFLYFLFLYFFDKKNIVYVLFSVICILFTGLIFFEYIKFFINYHYEFQFLRLKIIEWLHLLLTLAIPVFFVMLFKLPFRKIIIIALTFFTIIIFIGSAIYLEYGYDASARHLNFSLVIFSILISAYAMYLKRIGSTLIFSIFIFVLCFTFLNPFHDNMDFISNFDVAIFISFMLVIIGMLIVLSLIHNDQRKKYEQSLVTSERLKNELLKKNIKPHFIMNTLTSLIDWVEESPKQGVEFIHALADEFEVLDAISDHALVPIGQEIKLCKKHLEIMQFRKEIKYGWKEINIDYNEIIPPAIIHTAIENGITHCRPNKEGGISFVLEFSKDSKGKSYKIYTYGITIKPNKTITEGTGTKYIKARLQESYKDNWDYTSGYQDYGWLAEIIIKS